METSFTINQIKQSYNIIRNKAKGNCLFEAFADGLKRYDSNMDYRNLRSTVCDYFLLISEKLDNPRSRLSVLEQYIKFSADDSYKPSNMTYRTYFSETICKDFYWGGDKEIHALANILGLSVTLFIHSGFQGIYTKMDEINPTSSVKLFIIYHSAHYEALIPKGSIIVPPKSTAPIKVVPVKVAAPVKAVAPIKVVPIKLAAPVKAVAPIKGAPIKAVAPIKGAPVKKKINLSEKEKERERDISKGLQRIKDITERLAQIDSDKDIAKKIYKKELKMNTPRIISRLNRTEKKYKQEKLDRDYASKLAKRRTASMSRTRRDISMAKKIQIEEDRKIAEELNKIKSYIPPQQAMSYIARDEALARELQLEFDKNGR